MNLKARTSKKNSFIFGFGRGAQVGKASFLEVYLRRKRRRWAYHFHLVRFRPWDSAKPRIWKKTEHFLTMRSKIQCLGIGAYPLSIQKLLHLPGTKTGSLDAVFSDLDNFTDS